ncbi:hypothetical protein GCM10022403_085120 [Streptomyces coacervatus]|uniref:Uncharacterized protein n=1 Tax=Streptomyces coacervatus TaxID=647381 RepID=A0ABP7JAZ4_9ACTN
MAVLVGATGAFAEASPSASAASHPWQAHSSSVETGVTVPSVGRSWVADFGDETTFGGPFGAKITYTSSRGVCQAVEDLLAVAFCVATLPAVPAGIVAVFSDDEVEEFGLGRVSIPLSAA